MKKKILSLALALTMCLGLTVPAFAAESEWKLEVPGKSNAQVFVGKKTFTFRDCGFYDYDMITHEQVFYKEDDRQWTVENVCVLAKGDTAVFTYTYKPQESTGQGAFSGSGISSPVFQMIAWSDPDGDGVYDKRLIKERDLDNYDYAEDGYCDLLPEDRYEVLPAGFDAKNNPTVVAWQYQSSWSERGGVDEEQNYEEVRLSADRLLELFGPNTLVGIYEGDLYISDPAEMDWFILVEGNVQPTTPTEPEKPVEPEVKTANPTNDKLEVNGAAQNPTVYKIGGSNYFKIRDVAAVLNGTEKQFAVGYSGGKVTVTSGQPYEATGKELAGAPAAAKEASPSKDAIVIDGVETSLTVYKIGGSNYFKLRDLGKALNFYVGWEAGRGVYIETDKPYSK